MKKRKVRKDKIWFHLSYVKKLRGRIEKKDRKIWNLNRIIDSIQSFVKRSDGKLHVPVNGDLEIMSEEDECLRPINNADELRRAILLKIDIEMGNFT